MADEGIDANVKPTIEINVGKTFGIESNMKVMAFSDKIFSNLKTIFKTEGQPFIYAANGHGAWEAAI